MPMQYSGTQITFPDNSTQNTAPSGMGFKNRIINGAMMIDQRNAGASVSVGAATGTYGVDRFACWAAQASKLTVQQNAGSVTPPIGFQKYLGFTTASAYSAGATDYFLAVQKLEGLNMADLAWGTANASAITVSFWVRSSLTGTFSGAMQNGAGNRTYIFTYTVSAANTWEYKTVTIPGDTTGTWPTDNSEFGEIKWDLGAGSNYQGSAGSWAASGAFATAAGVKVVANAGATFYITGVQLEKGSTATSFDYRPYGTELALCQRYLPCFAGTLNVSGQAYQTTHAQVIFPFPVQTRVTPTGITVNANNAISVYNASGGGVSATAITFAQASTNFGNVDITVSSGLTTGNATIGYGISSSTLLYFTGCEL